MIKGYVLDFVPPLEGFEGEFNTIRMGVKWTKLLQRGDHVYLQNSKDKMIFAKAEVISVEQDTFGQICLYHAANNHSEIGRADGNSASRIYKLMTKFLGPHIVNHSKKACVVYLRRIE